VRELTAGASTAELFDLYAQVDRRARRRWVFANMVCGLDGTATFGGRVGPLSTGADRELFLRMRSLADVVLVGAETVRRERYGPIRLMGDPSDAASGRRTPPIAIVSRSLALDWCAPLFQADAHDVAGVRPIIVTCGAAPREKLIEAQEHATVIVAGERVVELGAALAALATLGHQVVLCEGGPRLLGELVHEGLLDELCLTIAPVMGGDPLPVALVAGNGLPIGFDLEHVAVDQSMIFLRYERRDVE
jgi:riboflavin biosynthesis pyrimidine reductase